MSSLSPATAEPNIFAIGLPGASPLRCVADVAIIISSLVGFSCQNYVVTTASG